MFNSLKKKIDKLERSMDVKRWWPGYIDRWYFRGAFFIILILLIVIVAQDGLTIHAFSYTCPKNSRENCLNTLYYCKHSPEQAINYMCDVPNFEEICAQGLCDQEYLKPGEVLGRKPHFLTANFEGIMFGLIALAFILNHLAYWRRTGNSSYKEPVYLEICAHDWKYWRFFFWRMRTCKICLRRETVREK